MIAYGLIALAVVLYILGLTDSYESGLSIKPMDQFAVYPLFGDGPVRWYTPTNATLWMGLAVLSIAVLMVMGTGGRAVIPRTGQACARLYGSRWVISRSSPVRPRSSWCNTPPCICPRPR